MTRTHEDYEGVQAQLRRLFDGREVPRPLVERWLAFLGTEHVPWANIRWRPDGDGPWNDPMKPVSGWIVAVTPTLVVTIKFNAVPRDWEVGTTEIETEVHRVADLKAIRSTGAWTRAGATDGRPEEGSIKLEFLDGEQVALPLESGSPFSELPGVLGWRQ